MKPGDTIILVAGLLLVLLLLPSKPSSLATSPQLAAFVAQEPEIAQETPIKADVVETNETSCDYQETYEQAYSVAQKRGRPLMVMLTAKWCGPCQQYKRDTLEPMAKANEFDGFVFVKVDVDEDARNASQIQQVIGKKTVPQVVVFYDDGEKKCSVLSGKQPVEKVRELLSCVRKALIR